MVGVEGPEEVEFDLQEGGEDVTARWLALALRVLRMGVRGVGRDVSELGKDGDGGRCVAFVLSYACFLSDD